MRRALLAAAVLLAVVLAGGLAFWQPFLSDPRPAITSTPQPAPIVITDKVALRPGARACIAPVVFSPHSARAQLIVASAPHGGGPALRLRARGGGGRYGSGGRLAGGYGTGPVGIAFAPPPREVRGRLCVANAGDRAVSLIASNEVPTISRTKTTVDGKPIAPRIALTLTTAAPQSIFDRLGRILDHAAAFKPVPPALLWALALLVLVALPLLAAAALWSSLRERR